MTFQNVCSICKTYRIGKMLDRCCDEHRKRICLECFLRWIPRDMVIDLTNPNFSDCHINWFEEPWVSILMSDDQIISDLHAMEEELR